MTTLILCFFFSSRRRHTILQGDWSSDVCSSDLGQLTADIAHDVPLAEIMTKRLKRITMDDSIQQTRPREHTFLMRNQLHIKTAVAERTVGIGARGAGYKLHAPDTTYGVLNHSHRIVDGGQA